MSLDPPESLAERITSLGELVHFAIKLDRSFDTVRDTFPDDPPALCVHIIVEPPRVGEST